MKTRSIFIFRGKYYNAQELSKLLKRLQARMVNVYGTKDTWAMYRGGFYTGKVFATVCRLHVQG